MKYIQLKVVPPSEEQLEEILQGQLEPNDDIRARLSFRYKENLLNILRSPMNTQSGVSIEEMEKSIDILGLVKKVEPGGLLALENDQYDFLIQKLNSVKFNTIDERILEFVKDIKNAPSEHPALC